MNKNMHKTISYQINLIRVLDALLENPMSDVTIQELLNKRGLRLETYEKTIRNAIDHLVKMKILGVTKPWGAPRKNKKNATDYDRKWRYKLSKTAYAYRQVFNIYLADDINKLITSEYTNSTIEKIGFEKLFKIIEQNLLLPKFNHIASKSLLNHKATKDEYANLAIQLKDKIVQQSSEIEHNGFSEHGPVELSNFLAEIGQELTIKIITRIDILSKFNPLQSIPFYRDTLHPTIIEAYSKLAEESIISRGLRDLLIFDNYLSPLTAHPASSVIKILFAKPFERIYEDAYLMGAKEFSLLSYRAFAVYIHFSDLLFEYFKYNPLNQDDREIVIKDMIYSWNVASTRFDLTCNCLAALYNKKTGSGCYHLKSDGMNFSVIDMADKKQLLPSDISSSILVLGSTPFVFSEDELERSRLYPEIMKNPFTSLRPCLSFKDTGKMYEFIPIEYISSELKRKIEANVC